LFPDLEDAVAPGAKADARTRVTAALAEPGWAGQLRGVRVNDWTTDWTRTDVIEVIAAAGAYVDLIVLPKVVDVSHVHALDLLLTQLEAIHELPLGRIAIEAPGCVVELVRRNSVNAVVRQGHWPTSTGRRSTSR
jgi:citrate lyase subunit beta / citryl-CoA lyase